MGSPQSTGVVLMGARLDHNENLGLGFVAAALRKANLRVVIAPLNSWLDMAPIAEMVISLRPRLVGIALAETLQRRVLLRLRRRAARSSADPARDRSRGRGLRVSARRTHGRGRARP